MVSPNPLSSIYALPSAVRSPTRALHETYWRISGLTEGIDPAKGGLGYFEIVVRAFSSAMARCAYHISCNIRVWTVSYCPLI